MIAQFDFILPRNPGFRRETNAPALRNQNLRLDQIQPSHTFGHRMFNLNAGVNLDKVKFGCIDIHQKLDRTGIDVICRLAQAHGGLAQFGALVLT